MILSPMYKQRVIDQWRLLFTKEERGKMDPRWLDYVDHWAI